MNRLVPKCVLITVGGFFLGYASDINENSAREGEPATDDGHVPESSNYGG